MLLERELDENTEIPVEKYLPDVLLVGVSQGKAPTSTEYEKLGRYSETSGRRKFYTWDNTLGVLCSRVFNMREPLGLLISKAEQIKEQKGTLPNKEHFEKETNTKTYWLEWKIIQEDVGEENREKELTEDLATKHFIKYRDNWSTEKNNRNFLLTMSKIFKYPPQEYARYYTTIETAERLSGKRDLYPIGKGRGSRRKLDEYMRTADDYITKRKPLDQIPGNNTEIKKIIRLIEENLPEQFLDIE